MARKRGAAVAKQAAIKATNRTWQLWAFDEQARRAAEIRAAAEGRTVSALVADAIKEYLAANVLIEQ